MALARVTMRTLLARTCPTLRMEGWQRHGVKIAPPQFSDKNLRKRQTSACVTWAAQKAATIAARRGIVMYRAIERYAPLWRKKKKLR